MDLAHLAAEIPMLGEMIVYPPIITITGDVQLAYVNVWIEIAKFVAVAFISYAMMPKPKTPRPAAFEDFDFPQFEEGTPMAVFFGDCWTADWMVGGVGNYRTEPVKSGGGKK